MEYEKPSMLFMQMRVEDVITSSPGIEGGNGDATGEDGWIWS